jgi:hypothetical protein
MGVCIIELLSSGNDSKLNFEGGPLAFLLQMN